MNELMADFALSPVKARALREIAEEMVGALSDSRPDEDVVYWAVGSTEPAGKPLDACRLVPVRLTLYDREDVPPPDVDRDLNRLSGIKFRKALRYATQAKHAGGYLTYADLGYLLGIHPEAISRLVRSHPAVAVPLRGAECDIGRGVTHRKKIIQLYLEMHTETEIVARTGHSYEAIENYIKEFAAVLVLAERGLTVPLIRRVTGQSVKLINTYLELIQEYSGPEYAFRLHHLRKVFELHEDELKKPARCQAMNRHEFYRPLVERTLVNYQVQYLARRYDFGKESLVARLLMEEINRRMEETESVLGIERVRPFELYVQKAQNQAQLPLFCPEYLEPILGGGDFSMARKLILKRCLQSYLLGYPRGSQADLVRIIDPWSLVRRKGPSRYIDQLCQATMPYSKTDAISWDRMIDQINPRLPTDRLQAPDLLAPGRALKELAEFVAAEAGLGRVVARQLVEEVIALRNICCPRTKELKPYEMPLIVTHVSARLSEDVSTRFRQLVPVIITVWKPEELDRQPDTVPGFLAQLKRRLVRVCFEAYRQNGLLTLMELQWIFQISAARISELIRSVQREHNLVLPTPGTTGESPV